MPGKALYNINFLRLLLQKTMSELELCVWL